jgi:dihydroflavonol-4-reductase
LVTKQGGRGNGFAATALFYFPNSQSRGRSAPGNIAEIGLKFRARARHKAPMNCFVTGASGFIGANLVHELAARGHRVKALLRPNADVRGLAGADYEPVPGDLLDDHAKLVAAMRGCDWCFHVAASYHLWLPDYAPMYAANVDGTRNLLEAAHAAGSSRIVYTSTVGCIGLPKEVNGQVTPTDENTPVAEAQMSNHYKLSKWKSEVVARELVSKGLPIVIVNPSAPIGPRDVKPTPTGKVIVDFANRQMPAYLDTGLNWVHVRDVAVGHILAAEKGRVGERYILGNANGNWTMAEAFAVLAEICDVPAPRFRVPYAVALMAAHVDETLARFTGKPPKAPLAGVRMARYKMFFNPSKAIRELGLPQTPPRQALSDAVEWFRGNGYVHPKL